MMHGVYMLEARESLLCSLTMTGRTDRLKGGCLSMEGGVLLC